MHTCASTYGYHNYWVCTVNSCTLRCTLQSQTNAVATWSGRQSHVHHSGLGRTEGDGLGGAGSAAEEVDRTVTTVEMPVALNGVKLLKEIVSARVCVFGRLHCKSLDPLHVPVLPLQTIVERLQYGGSLFLRGLHLLTRLLSLGGNELVHAIPGILLSLALSLQLLSQGTLELLHYNEADIGTCV